MKTCPKCQSELLEGSDICLTCNWEIEEESGGKKKSKKRKTHDGQCDFTADGKRCPLPGSMSHSTVGGGPCFCKFHFKRKGDEGRAILAELVNDPQKVRDFYRARLSLSEVHAKAHESHTPDQILDMYYGPDRDKSKKGAVATGLMKHIKELAARFRKAPGSKQGE